jgi:hypothetical protein
MRALMEKCRDLPMDLADAALVRVPYLENGGQLITVAVSIFVGRYRQKELNHSTGTRKR